MGVAALCAVAGCSGSPRTTPRSEVLAPVAKSVAPSGESTWPLVAVGASEAGVGEVAIATEGPVVLLSGAGELSAGGSTLASGGDAGIVALDLEGHARWAHRVEAPGHVTTDGLAVAADGSVVFVGSFTGTLAIAGQRVEAGGERSCFVAVLEPDGTPRHLVGLGGEETTLCRGTALDVETVWVVGFFDGALPLPGEPIRSHGLPDVFVLEVDVARGEPRHGFAFGTAGEDVGRDIVVTPRGVIVTGSYASPFGPDGALDLGEEARTLSLGPSSLSPVGDADGFVAAFDRDGAPQWATRLAGPGFDVVKQASPLGDGIAVSVASQREAPPAGVSGLVSDVPLSGFVAHLGPDGAERWRWGHPSIVSPHGLASTDAGVAVVGHYREGLVVAGEAWPARGETDVMLVELDSGGVPIFGAHCGGPGPDFGYALAAEGASLFFGGRASPASTCGTPSATTVTGFLARRERG